MDRWTLSRNGRVSDATRHWTTKDRMVMKRAKKNPVSLDSSAVPIIQFNAMLHGVLEARIEAKLDRGQQMPLQRQYEGTRRGSAEKLSTCRGVELHDRGLQYESKLRINSWILQYITMYRTGSS